MDSLPVARADERVKPVSTRAKRSKRSRRDKPTAVGLLGYPRAETHSKIVPPKDCAFRCSPDRLVLPI